MEVLAAVASHLAAAKASLIRAGIEMNKLPVPIQHGCKLLRMVADLDKIERWCGTDEADDCEADAVRGKPKKSRRLKLKERQSHPQANTPESSNDASTVSAGGPATLSTGSPSVAALPKGSKLIG